MLQILVILICFIITSVNVCSFKPPLLSLFHTHRVFYKYICYAFSCQKKLNKFIIVFFLKSKTCVLHSEDGRGGGVWKGCKKKKDTYHYINISNSLLVKFFFFRTSKYLLLRKGKPGLCHRSVPRLAGPRSSSSTSWLMKRSPH